MQSSIIDCSHHAVHYILMTCSYYNWKPVPLDSLHLILCLSSPDSGNTNLFSVFLSTVCFFFLDSTYKWDHGSCLSLTFFFVSLSIFPSRHVHVATNGKISFCLWLNNIPLFTYGTFSLSIRCWWTFRMLPYLGYYNNGYYKAIINTCSNEHGAAHL